MKLSQAEKQAIIQKEAPRGMIIGFVFFMVVLAMTMTESLKPLMTEANIIGAFLIIAGLSGAITGQTISYNTFSWKIYAFRGRWVRFFGLALAALGVYLILI